MHKNMHRMSGGHLDHESALVFIWMYKSDLDYEGALGCLECTWIMRVH